jgi:hypothetical protein
MTDQASPEGAAAPDANASQPAPQTEVAQEPKTGSEAESSPAAADSGEQQPERKGVGKRIDELTRLRREAERREAAADARVQKLMEMVERLSTQPQRAPAESSERSLADFGGDEKAYRDHLFNRAREEARTEAQRAVTERTDEWIGQQNRDASRAEFDERAEKFANSVEDYEEITSDPTLPITPVMADAIIDSEAGPEIFYYLGNNRDLARKISAMSPARAGAEIARIESKLAAERAKAKPKTVSQAPAPTPRLEAKEAGAVRVSASSAESDKLSTDEWMKARERELRRKKD